ncbi:hypothetical protein GC173_06955 [bacterium]|nr:hypothetical protein [bacterium]
MGHDVLVAGFVNVETQVRVEAFPIPYEKSRFVFHGVADNLSGVALNVSAALKRLGHSVALATLIGDDLAGGIVESELRRMELVSEPGFRKDPAVATARTVVLSAANGADSMFTDLKHHQEYTWPDELVRSLVRGAPLVHATNINWGLQFARAGREAGCVVATDVHAISSLDDPYNSRFLQVADIVFFSAEKLAVSLDDFVEELFRRYPARLVVVGLGAEGAFVRERGGLPIRLPATPLRPIVSATGCGDAMAAAFLSCHLRGFPPEESLRRAQLFAGWKIGELGGSRGHLTRARLDEIADQRP